MIRIEILAPELWTALGGVMQLRGSAYVEAVALRPGVFVALAIVLAAGLSEAFGQSIVLFANRVRPARFVFSLFVDALLFTFGYGFLVLSTWAVTRLPQTAHLSLRELAIVIAMSYAPMLFAFLTALPYLGSGLMRVLRVWHLLAMVVGVAAVGGVDVFAAATYVWLGWIVMVLAQHSFGRPIVNLGARLLDAVAGVQVIDDASLVIGRVESGTKFETEAPQVAVETATSKHPGRWAALLGLGAMALLAIVVALALEPVREGILGWQEHLPHVLRLPLDLLWLGVIALVVAGFMAPFETLGWWAGWYGDEIDTSDLTRPAQPVADATPAARYIVYLDGIAQSSSKYTSDIETFLDALSPRLPANVKLVRGVMAYSVLNKPLEDDPILSRFWKMVDANRSSASSLLGMLVNLRNVTIVAVSADPRYGPMYNFGIADVIYRSLIANGYPKKSGIPVSLVGYSGGGQMACGAAPFLKRALDAPVDVISLGGVISGNDPILQLEHLYHLVGDKDFVERIGPVMFASRWPIAPLSYWNRAKRLGALTCVSLGPVAHQVPGGMLDPDARLPDGRTYLRQTLDYILSILAGRFVAKTEPPKRPSNYGRYVEGTGTLWSELAANPPTAVGIGLSSGCRVDRTVGSAKAGRALRGNVVRRVGRSARAVASHWNAGAAMLVRRSGRAQAYPRRVARRELQRRSAVSRRVWRADRADTLESAAAGRSTRIAGRRAPDRRRHREAVRRVTAAVEPGGPALRIEREPVQIGWRVLWTTVVSRPGAGHRRRLSGRALRPRYGRLRRRGRNRADAGRSQRISTSGRTRRRSVSIARRSTPRAGTSTVDSTKRHLRRPGVGAARAAARRRTRRSGRCATRLPIRATRGLARLVEPRAASISAGMAAAVEVREPALLVHTYGGIGGRRREKAASRADLLRTLCLWRRRSGGRPIADEPRFSITYYQVYTRTATG